MTTTLVVLAHPETRSFCGQWADATTRAAEALGDRVLRSDLHGFDPIERAGHYDEPVVPFDVLKAQESASFAGQIPEDVLVEVEKLEAADRVIFHFPLWWFAIWGSMCGNRFWFTACMAITGGIERSIWRVG